jgi:hypothetical protein
MKFINRVFAVVLFFGVVLTSWVVDPGGPVLAQSSANEGCLACHGEPGMQTTLPSGEVLYLTVDPEVYEASVHGQQGMLCSHCHANAEYPHPPLTVSTRRDLSLSYYRSSCILCHRDKYDATLDSVHQVALAGGDTRAAICTDCHGTHNIRPPDQPRSRSSQMCALCHSEIFERYKNSVHGAALIGDGNPDVPSCTDCHQVHSTEGPHTGAFHLFSPQICAECHADPDMMGRYGISTDVFDTYVADFHGTTVVLFQSLAPDQQTNKPVCIDCHGVHDMKEVDDPESSVMKENLLSTCRKCHPGATANFPTSWISHYRPDPKHAPPVYYVRLFYEFFIPILIIGMILFVASDARRRIVDRRNRKKERHYV